MKPSIVAWVGLVSFTIAWSDTLSGYSDRRAGMVVGATFMIAALIWHLRRRKSSPTTR